MLREECREASPRVPCAQAVRHGAECAGAGHRQGVPRDGEQAGELVGSYDAES